MKILLIYPRYPVTFWSFDHVLKIIGKKAAFPPLGLLTVASLLPKKWEKKLVDMNIDELSADNIEWADMIFVSAMIIQKDSAKEVIERVRNLGKKVVAGGPLFTTGWKKFGKKVDHLVLGEAEEIFSLFLKDLKKGKLKKIYSSKVFPNLKRRSVIPDYSLIDINKYNSMCIQYSRGCPFNCEFCDIAILNGRVPRFKTKGQIIKEFDNLYNLGWRGGIFFVDDNFIGNRAILKKEILPAIWEWQKKKRQPFLFITQASINLADDKELIRQMVKVGFTTVFIGIETPNPDSLAECMKIQNKNRDLIDSVKLLQNEGLEVQGGFIVGFDHDTASIFKRQIEFIQKSGIVTAMVGLLTALPETKLYKRLQDTGRLIKETTGSNMATEVNFVPKMKKETLVKGYRDILNTIYSPKEYYKRIKTFASEFRPTFRKTSLRMRTTYIRALIASFWLLGIKNEGRGYFWKLVFWSIFRKPKVLPQIIGFSVVGIHFRRLYGDKNESWN